MFRYTTALLIGLLLLGGTACDKKNQASNTPGKIKIGFVVKQAEERWFQNEWKFAQMAADKDGFDLIKIAAPTDERVVIAIDTLKTQGAQGLIICTPNVRLGPVIVRKAKDAGLKLMTVDDQLIGTDGKFMDVHHMGISAHNIGRLVGKALLEEMKKRNWDVATTGAAIMTYEQLDTARERTDGAIEALKEGGFPAGQIYKQPHKSPDTPAAFDATGALLTTHPNVKNWLVAGMNDAVVLGAVKAMENRGFSAEQIIGIGINGDTALNEFKQQKMNGFFASVLLSPRRHGYETSDMMYHWIKDGKEPPKTTYTDGILITRDNYKQVLKEQGMDD